MATRPLKRSCIALVILTWIAFLAILTITKVLGGD